MSDTHTPEPVSQPAPRNQQVLDGLPQNINDKATFNGREGYWVQGDCVFIADAPSPEAAIGLYRRRMSTADCGVYHNQGTQAVGLLQANAALATATQEREAPVSKAEADCLAFAVRYALERPSTTAPSTVAPEVVRLWPRLQGWQQKQLKGEIITRTYSCITRAYDSPEAWQQVLNLPDSPTPNS